MSRLKELYLAKSFAELDKMHQRKLQNHTKAKLLCIVAQKLIKEAEQCNLLGDEEQSYICLMKYFMVLGHMRKCPDFKAATTYINECLGSNTKQLALMEKTEVLKKSLHRRYELLELASRPINNQTKLDIESMDTGKDLEKDVPRTTISCEELHNLIVNHRRDILVIDCRPASDLQLSQLRFADCLCIPEEKIQMGLSAGKLRNLLKDDKEKTLWQTRSNKQHVVLMDWNCSAQEPSRGTALFMLKDIMQNWDPDVNYKSLVILEGGYQYYILMYPMDSTNPTVGPSAVLMSRDDNIEDVEYPTLNDITMKDDSFAENDKPARPKVPVVDRGSKAAALKTYNKSDYLREKVLIVKKELQNRKKMLDTEIELRKIMDAEANQLDLASNQQQQLPDEREEDENKENQFTENMFRILQLNSTIDDSVMKKKELEEESQEMATLDVIDDDDDMESRQMAESIEATKKEIDHIKKLSETLVQERESKLLIAKEQKKYLQLRDTNRQSVVPPQPPVVPKIDRSVKPTSIIDLDIKRDFAPVYGQVGRGLTGLKNLGNTCYMNSIMQCLSNTSTLMEYFVTNLYRKHINYGNKTQGRIAKEVAALIRELWTGQCRFIASKDLRYIVGQYQQMFRGVEQQDSHEFLTILIDWLHSDLQTLVSNVRNNSELKLPPSDKAWLDYTKNKESNIFHLFYGQIKSMVKCKECLQESATYECFSNLSLELPTNNKRCDIYKSFDMYFHGETVHGWDCPKCKQKRDAIKKLDISRLPPILVIHFKRFYADTEYMAQNSYKKRANFVDFPIHNLDINDYVARSEKRLNARLNTNYNLYATSNHYGSMESGHYTAFCRNNLLGDWYKFDDSNVSRLDKSEVVTSGAYILFYTNLPEEMINPSIFKHL